MEKRKQERAKVCERCQRRDALTGERFCLPCRQKLKREMRESGYLDPEPPEESRRWKNYEA